MPFYRYRCEHGHEFEDLQSVNAENPTCPELTGEAQFDGDITGLCGAPTKRIPSVPGPPQGGPTPRFYR